MFLAQNSFGFIQAILLLVIFIPLLLFWAFALVDLFRRNDLSGFAVAGWLIVIILLPLFGPIIYLLFRPARLAETGGTEYADYEGDPTNYERAQGPSRYDTADQLDKLAKLRDRGVISDAEFEAEKAKLLAES